MHFFTGIRLSVFWLASLPIALVVILLLWFIPWVFVLHLGVLAYFPYEPNGISRFIRVTGPLVNITTPVFINSENIPTACKTALVASEDTRFFEHQGVDWESLQDSYKYNQSRKKIRRGGSTITQQLVKNAFLSRDKSYIRKVREIIGALSIDLIMSKDSQLTWYLNIVEFGANIYGINNASTYYFGVNASKLTSSQCIALVSVLPSPQKWGRSLAKKNMSSFLQARYRTILSRMIIMNNTPVKLIAQAKIRSPFGKNSLPKAAMPVVSSSDGIGVDAAESFRDVSDDVVSASREQEEKDMIIPPLNFTPSPTPSEVETEPLTVEEDVPDLENPEPVLEKTEPDLKMDEGKGLQH